MPIAPAPITSKRFGSESGTIASRAVQIIRPSGSMPGSDFARAPVAMTIASAPSTAGAAPSTASRPGSVKRAAAFEHLHLVLLEQAGHASIELLGNGARARDDACQVDARRTGVDTERGGAFDLAQHISGVQQRLGRNAAPVEANAADLRLFHQCGRETELRGAYGGDISAGTAADDDDVEGLFAHRYTSSRYGASSRSRTAPRNCAAGAPSSTR